jgi:hypothetical protein
METLLTVFFWLILPIGVFGFFGNIIVIIVYLYDKRLRSFTNYFFVNLSVVDILLIITSLPMALLDLVNNGIWTLGELVCNYQHFLEATLVSCSSLTLLSIGLERYFAISRPLKVFIHIYYFNSNTLQKLLIVFIQSIDIKEYF